MANEYAVNQDDLTAVADAIRAKGGTSDALSFPDGFVEAVGAIEAGGGDTSEHEQMLIAMLGGSNIAFKSEKLIKLRTQAFRDASVSSVEIPNLTTLSASTFEGCTSMRYAIIPRTNDIAPSCFKNCWALEKFDGSPGKFSVNAFYDCHKLTAVILRGPSVAVLSDIYAFNGTPLRGYGGTYSGHFYVKRDLISSYQEATNWSVLYADYPEIFQPIEGSEYE